MTFKHVINSDVFDTKNEDQSLDQAMMEYLQGREQGMSLSSATHVRSAMNNLKELQNKNGNSGKPAAAAKGNSSSNNN